MTPSRKSPSPTDPRGRTVPSSIIRNELGKVYVLPEGDALNVTCSLWLPELPGPMAEGWRTAIALDASASMRAAYGRALLIPRQLLQAYQEKEPVTVRQLDETEMRFPSPDSIGQLQTDLEQGRIRRAPNMVEPLARGFAGYLASQFDAEGRTWLTYWACGEEGDQIEEIGEFEADALESVPIGGPRKHALGNRTILTPTLNALSSRYPEAFRRLCVVLTDGFIQDLPEVKRRSAEICREIAQGEQPYLKLVLVGVGPEVDASQLQELDPPDSETGIDLWDYKLATHLRALSEIAVEIVEEHWIVGPPALIRDDQGREVARFTDGLPARFRFPLPRTSEFFSLEVQGQAEPIRQPVTSEENEAPQTISAYQEAQEKLLAEDSF